MDKKYTNQEIIEIAKTWAQNPYFSQADRDHLTSQLSDLVKNETELVEIFYRDLEFGTAGLRSIVGFGRNRINLYNIRKATHAFALVLKKYFSGPSVAISYDSRLSSLEFAHETCAVLSAHNITCHLMPEVTATPILSFAVRALSCSGGIMITASHNPKNYNGYKVYWNDGAQVTGPYDQEIIETYYQLSKWEDLIYDQFENSVKSGKIKMIGPDLYEKYYAKIISEAQDPQMIKDHGDQISIVYTPLHGTGGKPCLEVGKRLGFKNITIVSAQASPDGNFPTTNRPNPEEVQALKLAEDLMLKTNADLLIGSDPDTDRMGVMINLNCKSRFLNGNEIAVLLLDYKLSQMRKNKKIGTHPLVIKTIVTSNLQEKICQKYKTEMINTPTGFKWMAKAIKEKEVKNEKFQFIFASEESFGSMSHDGVRDKDGVSSFALMAELALFHKLRGKNLAQVLDELSEEHGFYFESLLNLEYEGKTGVDKIDRIMKFFRGYSENSILNFKIKSKEDFLESKYKSNIVGIHFEGDSHLYLRPSGTEPKIKFYTQLCLSEGALEEKKKNALANAANIEAWIKDVCSKI